MKSLYLHPYIRGYYEAKVIISDTGRSVGLLPESTAGGLFYTLFVG